MAQQGQALPYLKDMLTIQNSLVVFNNWNGQLRKI